MSHIVPQNHIYTLQQSSNQVITLITLLFFLNYMFWFVVGLGSDSQLVLTHFHSCRTSFVGHLAGILVGLLYTNGPLKRLMKTCAGKHNNLNVLVCVWLFFFYLKYVYMHIHYKVWESLFYFIFIFLKLWILISKDV